MSKRDDEILLIGRQMSNVLYNLGNNHPQLPSVADRSTFRELQQKWDAAVIKYRASFKRKKRGQKA